MQWNPFKHSQRSEYRKGEEKSRESHEELAREPGIVLSSPQRVKKKKKQDALRLGRLRGAHATHTRGLYVHPSADKMHAHEEKEPSTTKSLNTLQYLLLSSPDKREQEERRKEEGATAG